MFFGLSQVLRVLSALQTCYIACRCQALANSCFGPMAPWRPLCHAAVAGTYQGTKQRAEGCLRVFAEVNLQMVISGQWPWLLARRIKRMALAVGQANRISINGSRDPGICQTPSASLLQWSVQIALLFWRVFPLQMKRVTESDILANPGDARQKARHKMPRADRKSVV